MKPFWRQYLKLYSIDELLERGIFTQESWGKMPYYNLMMNYAVMDDGGHIVRQLQKTRSGKIKLINNSEDVYRYDDGEILLAVYKHVE